MPGSLTSSRVPYLPITVEIPERGVKLSLEALVDTGFADDYEPVWQSGIHSIVCIWIRPG